MSELRQALLGNVRSKISDVTFNTWFSQIVAIHLVDEGARIAVADRYVAGWLNDYYVDLLQDELQVLTGRRLSIRFEVHTSAAGAGGKAAAEPPAESPQAPRPLITSLVRAPIGEPLNPRYTFERFVVGANSQFAQAACKAVADLPGGHYNPLFVYGGVGLGKTHLLNAVGLGLQEQHPDLRILYIGSERFVNELINSIRYDKMAEFRRKYREGCDVLLIDDIQFIAGKERTQEEFFHTFNCLHDAHKQLVVTSDKLPKEIPGLEERLRSRFEWGLIADIQAPDLETRVAILRKKAENDRLVLPDAVAMHLAQQIQSNVRELEGSLIRLSAFASLNGVPMTVELAQEILKSLRYEVDLRCSIEAVQKLVADYYQLKVNELKSARRMKHFAFPRQIAMYLCKKHIKSSFPEIGQKFGGKDHTTVMHACRKIDRQMKTDPRLRDDIEFLEKSISRG